MKKITLAFLIVTSLLSCRKIKPEEKQPGVIISVNPKTVEVQPKQSDNVTINVVYVSTYDSVENITMPIEDYEKLRLNQGDLYFLNGKTIRSYVKRFSLKK